MGFLRDDEFFLLMDIAAVGSNDPAHYDIKPMHRYHHIDEDGLKAFRDAGIQTTLPFQCIWDEIEVEPGKYDWSYLDDYVNRATKCGMKTILFNATAGYPKWFPDSFFVTCKNGVHREALSPWNREAMDANNEFTRRLIERYYSPNHCLIASAQLSVGETVLLNEAAFYGADAIASYQKFTDSEDLPDPIEIRTNIWLETSYIDMLVEQQSIMARMQCDEIFLMLHPAIADFGFYGNGNNWIQDILHELRRRVAPVNINHIYYTWIQWPQYWPLMNAWAKAHDEHVFGGAEYAEGLPATTPAAIANGLRGQIIAPCYPGIHDKVEDWMVKNVADAQKLWLDAHIARNW